MGLGLIPAFSVLNGRAKWKLIAATASSRALQIGNIMFYDLLSAFPSSLKSAVSTSVRPPQHLAQRPH